MNNFMHHSSDKGNTPPDIYKSRFYELCDQFSDYYRIFTDGSKVGDKVAAAVVHKHNCKSVRLPNSISIFRAELYPAETPTLKKRWANVIVYVEKWSENDVGPLLK